ncbi:MAG: ABC transporter substrate-binding protein [Rhodobacterales bacterium]|jgi:hypothetical protein|nr:ABC transporter substrate-binding protein [Rhodobacterales bacterium]
MTRLGKKLSLAAVVGLGSALPAAAQTGLCGGIGDNGQWIGGAEATSDVSTATAAMEQMALVLQNNEYVALFTVSAAMDVRVEAQGRGAGDPVLELRDAAGTVVLSDDDSGGNGAARGEINLQPGTYCVSMKSYDGAPMTGFVRVGQLSHEPLTEGITEVVDGGDEFIDPMAGGTCDFTTVTNFLSDGPINNLLAMGGATVTASATDVPFWGFSLDAPATLTITADNEAADPTIALYDEYGNYLYDNDDFNGLNSQIDITQPLYEGNYCLSVSALTDTSMPITVTVKAYDAVAGLMGMYERGEASPPLDGSYPVEALGPLGNRLRKDITTTSATTWFSLDVNEGGLLLVEAVTNEMGDPTLVLFDDFGRQVAFNDDNGDSLDSMLTARVMPGTYLVGVRQLSEDTSVLTRLLFERYVPAQ